MTHRLTARRLFVCHLLVALGLAAPLAFAQAAVTSVQPRSCRPGTTTRLTLTGKDLGESLRVASSCAAARVVVESVEPEKAVVAITLPGDAPLGPAGLWLATSAGPAEPIALLVDDLPLEIDSGENHSRETAQSIGSLVAVDGTCDKGASDFYRMRVARGQRLAVEVLTEPIGSAMDPVVCLTDENSQTLRLADDDDVGPDCRFSFQFDRDGEVYLEIRDNRYGGGSAYHLRVGDFPLVHHAYPLALRRGDQSPPRVATWNGELLESRGPTLACGTSQPSAERQACASELATVEVRWPGGQSSAWVPVVISDVPQQVELPETGTQAQSPQAQSQQAQSQQAQQAAASIPLGISGMLAHEKERDQYRLSGVKGQSVRFRSRTRSLGCSTLLAMRLFDAGGAKVAETSVSDSDEWSFDYTFPDDAEYLLEVNDLLDRGGPGFAYWVDVAPAGSFSVALRAEATVRERFPIEPQFGACAVDLQVERFGYDGQIQLSVESGKSGLRILNPVIPAGAKEFKLYLLADDTWTSDDFVALRLLAAAQEHPSVPHRVTSVTLHRTKEPQIPFPPAWSDGTLVFSGVAETPPFWALESNAEFARGQMRHTATVNLKRLHKDFQSGVTILGDAVPRGWQLETKVDKETYSLSLSRPEGEAQLPAELPLLVYAEFNGRGRIDKFQIPIHWIDPLRVSIESSQPFVAGQKQTLLAKIDREGDDPQPVTIRPGPLPAGIGAPAAIDVPPDQQQVAFDIEVTGDVQVKSAELDFVAATRFHGNELEVTGPPVPLQIIARPARLDVYPAQIELAGRKDRRQLVITGYDAAESPADWTRRARITATDPEIVELRDAVAFPKANGRTDIVIEVGELQERVPITVSGMETEPKTGFEAEVLVALSKQGCNSGACHGSPSGKGMFRLSLRAFDRQLDEVTLIREDGGRRVNRMEPQRSLLLMKPLMKVSHGGGKRLHADDVAYEILRDWIAEGAAADPPGAPRCVKLEVMPGEKRILSRRDGQQQLAAVAHFSDGSVRDVSHLVAYESSNTSVATVDEKGLVTPRARGESVILVRYLEHIESIPLMFVEEIAGFQWQAPAPHNYVDELVNAKLRQLQFLPSATCNDSEFLRRVYLDVIGVLPTVEESQAFLADDRENKRAMVIDQLLERDEYGKFWALKWGDLLKMTGKLVGDQGVYKYYRWVEEAFHDNMPYDEFARQLLTSSGSTWAHPAANFYRTATDMNECVETISQLFLGARLQCAKCHNHPFESWTQDNYYGLGAFFERVQRRKTQRPGEMFVWTAASGEVIQPRTGQQMQPWLPEGGRVEAGDGDRRVAFARWLVSADNPYFAKIEANRIWGQLFSRGIVEPIDDFRDSNPPSNGALLDALADDFIHSGFDRKHLLRVILNSRTYQASCQTNAMNATDALYFSHQEPRLLAAEQLLDAISQVTGVTQALGNLPPGTKATQLPAPDMVKVDFLKVFGQPERSTVCACERAADSNLGMAMELFNGTTVHEKLRDTGNRFHRAIAGGRALEEIVEELYLAALCRPASRLEMSAAVNYCRKQEKLAAGIEDLCWALLNTDEFLFQH